MRNEAERSFTLIELLIVVAIIAILAAIAVPNFQEAQVRSKVSRVKTDMRSMSVAMEAYCVDANAYPVDAVVPFPTVPWLGQVAWLGEIMLTTPVAYMTSIPPDPFASTAIGGYGKAHFEMGTGSWDLPGNAPGPARMWAMASYGPDRKDNTNLVALYPYTADATPYDPTNGTISRGDICRLGPFTTHPNFESDANPLNDSNNWGGYMPR